MSYPGYPPGPPGSSYPPSGGYPPSAPGYPPPGGPSGMPAPGGGIPYPPASGQVSSRCPPTRWDFILYAAGRAYQYKMCLSYICVM